ncbi:MAG: prolipoprotein diacylglyceryl transferase [Anaerolineae bacterium]|nr:prolipoprotein diacylglyceryl transferase [Anaerolineae bacterium]
MIDPIIFSIDLGFTQLTVRWYGVLIVAGVLIAATYASWYVKRKNEDPNIVWDLLIWLLISGIIGARLWYVIADIIGGGTRYLEDPIRILFINEGGLNILGGVMVGAIVTWYYTKRNNIDFWLIADAIGPAYLIGQAIGRWGNFINQELYGPPTTLPWGIPIDAEHRLPPWNDLATYPVETTRFHPTFAYEMIWNLVLAGILIYLIVKHGDKLRTGVIAGLSLIAAGVGRTWIELYFRPDQPRFFGTPVSTSLIISVIFALLGLFIVLVKAGKISVPFMKPGSTEYAKRFTRRPPVPRKTRRQKM